MQNDSKEQNVQFMQNHPLLLLPFRLWTEIGLKCLLINTSSQTPGNRPNFPIEAHNSLDLKRTN